MRSTLKVPQCITKGVLAIICSNSFSHCKGDQKKTVAISQMFSHVQLHVHWMHLFNTRICRYICIYVTPTLQTLHYCPAGAWRRNDVVLVSMWRHHVASTSYACWVWPRQVCKKLSDLENEIYRVQSGVLPTKFGHKLLLSLSAQPDYMWKNWIK